MIQQQLLWHNHINNLKSKIAKQCGIMYTRTKKYRDPWPRKRDHWSLVQEPRKRLRNASVKHFIPVWFGMDSIQSHPSLVSMAAFLSNHRGVPYCIEWKGSDNFWCECTLGFWATLEWFRIRVHTRGIPSHCTLAQKIIGTLSLDTIWHTTMITEKSNMVQPPTLATADSVPNPYRTTQGWNASPKRFEGVFAAPELVISDPFFEARGPDNFWCECTHNHSMIGTTEPDTSGNPAVLGGNPRNFSQVHPVATKNYRSCEDLTQSHLPYPRTHFSCDLPKIAIIAHFAATKLRLFE